MDRKRVSKEYERRRPLDGGLLLKGVPPADAACLRVVSSMVSGFVNLRKTLTRMSDGPVGYTAGCTPSLMRTCRHLLEEIHLPRAANTVF